MQGNCRLVIKSAVLEDSGEYICKIDKQDEKTITEVKISGELSTSLCRWIGLTGFSFTVPYTYFRLLNLSSGKLISFAPPLLAVMFCLKVDLIGVTKDLHRCIVTSWKMSEISSLHVVFLSDSARSCVYFPACSLQNTHTNSSRFLNTSSSLRRTPSLFFANLTTRQGTYSGSKMAKK